MIGGHIFSAHPEAMEKLGIPIKKKPEEEIEEIKKRLDELEKIEVVKLPEPPIPEPLPPERNRIPPDYFDKDIRPNPGPEEKNSLMERWDNVPITKKIALIAVIAFLLLYFFAKPDNVPFWDYLNTLY